MTISTAITIHECLGRELRMGCNTFHANSISTAKIIVESTINPAS